jgi:hypothetical protein
MQYSDVSARAVSSLSNANKTVAFAFGDFFGAGSKPKFVGARGKNRLCGISSCPASSFLKALRRKLFYYSHGDEKRY